MGCTGSKTPKPRSKEVAAAQAEAARDREQRARDQVRQDNLKAKAMVKQFRSEGRMAEAAEVRWCKPHEPALFLGFRWRSSQQSSTRSS